MVKAGIYGLFRVIALMGAPPAWWGWTLLGLGLASGVLGVLWALAQHDLKRLLAYHTVENIGIILIGMAVGVLGLGYGHPTLAVLGFAGALLHTLNHALFKSLLFLGAGAVIRQTGTRLIDHLGGLGRRMPLTALAFGIGAAAIIGLPPLNGFLSEWVIFSALLESGRSPDAMRIAAAAAGGLALIGGLALVCFAKVTGVMFLGRPRLVDSQSVVDPAVCMAGPITLLALACLVIGVFPWLVLSPALGAASTLAAVEFPAAAPSWTGAADILSGFAGGLIILTLLLLLLGRWRWGVHPPRRRETWACGGLPDLARAQYTASSFASPVLGAFGTISGLRETRTLTSYTIHATDPVLDGAVRPVWSLVDSVSQRIRAVQSGRIRWYLFAVVFTLIGLLLNLAMRDRLP
jgi:formate hydrogenlyase subunit 3/multisubunit Na+/H+ antiporter MnhD subunit